MKFTCERSLLTESLLNIQKAVAQNAVNPALSGVFIKTENDSTLTMSGYDLQFGITKSIQATVTTPGEIVLPARLFSEIVRKMDGDSVDITVSENLLTTIKSGLTETTIIAIDSSEYPTIPDVDTEKTLAIPQSLLKSMTDQTLFAVATDETKPVHTGIKFEVESNMLTLVSVDGSRLALCKSPCNGADIQFIVPGKVMGEISKLIRENEEDVNCDIYLSEKHILFNLDGYKVFSRLLEGNFLDYKNAIPKSSTTTVIINTKDFIKSIEKASVIINDRFKEPIKISFEEGCITVLCKTPLGKVQDVFTAEKEGSDLLIGFNNKYLLDALKNSYCDQVKLSFGGEVAPMTITPTQGDEFLFLVLPVRIKNEI